MTDELRDARAAGAGARPLRLGHSWSGLGRYTAPVLRRWREGRPDVPLELLRVDDENAGLARGTSDVSVVRGWVSDPDVHAESVFSEPRMAAVPVGSPIADRASLTPADLAGSHVVVIARAGTTTPRLWAGHARPADVVTVAGTDEWLDAIAAGGAAGVTTTAMAAMHPHPGVAFLPLTGTPEVPVFLAWRSPPSHPAVPDLVDLIRDVVQAA